MADEISIDDFFKTASDQQKRILFRLGHLAEEEKKYANQINSIIKAAQNGSGVLSLDGGYSLTVCEDMDDARVISAKPRQEYNRVRAEMKTCLIDAVQAGMNNLGIIRRTYENYVGEPLPKD